MMLNRNDTKGVIRAVRAVEEVVDEIVVVDSSSNACHLELQTALADSQAKVFRALPLGHPDPLAGYGLSKVSSERVLYLDSDEFPSKELVRDLRRLTRFEGYFVPRREGVLGYTSQIRLFKRDATAFTGRIHEQPTIDGRVGKLNTSHCILHLGMGSRIDESRRYFRRAIQAYSEIEGYERPPPSFRLAEGDLNSIASSLINLLGRR